MPSPAPDFYRSPFVGRDAELQALGVAVARIVAGEQSCISVIGEAGCGKTRLLDELRARVGADVRGSKAAPSRSERPRPTRR